MDCVLIIEAMGNQIALVLVVRTIVMFVFLPIIVLRIYTCRIAMIASWSGSMGPFVPQIGLEE